MASSFLPKMNVLTKRGIGFGRSILKKNEK